MTYGEIIFGIGIVVVAMSLILIIFGKFIFQRKKKKLKEKLYDKYGL